MKSERRSGSKRTSPFRSSTGRKSALSGFNSRGGNLWIIKLRRVESRPGTKTYDQKTYHRLLRVKTSRRFIEARWLPRTRASSSWGDGRVSEGDRKSTRLNS